MFSKKEKIRSCICPNNFLAKRGGGSPFSYAYTQSRDELEEKFPYYPNQ